MRVEDRGLLVALGVTVVVLLLLPALGGGMMWPGMMWPGMMWPGMMWPGMMWPGMMWPGMMGAVGPQGMPPNVSGWAWGLGMGLSWLMVLAFWGVVIFGIVLVVRWVLRTTTLSGRGGEDSALEILRRRYAAGEIAREQFDQMRRDLET